MVGSAREKVHSRPSPPRPDRPSAPVPAPGSMILHFFNGSIKFPLAFACFAERPRALYRQSKSLCPEPLLTPHHAASILECRDLAVLRHYE